MIRVGDTSSGSPPRFVPDFTRALLAAIIITLTPVLLLNLIVDPFSIFGAGILNQSESPIEKSRIDLLDEFEPKPECLIIGSSRTLSFDPSIVEELTGLRTFNFSGVSPRTEVIYAAMRIALDDFHCPLKTVIIGVDPESFHPTLPIPPEVRYNHTFARYFNPHGIIHETLTDNLLGLLTLETLDASLGKIRNYFRKATGTEKMSVAPNGYTVWTQRELGIADGTWNLQGQLNRKVRKYPERSLAISSYKELSESRMQYWQDIIALCRDHGIKLYVFLTPVHPQLYGLFKSIGVDKLLEKLSTYLQTSVGQINGVFRDYTSIESFGGNTDDFYDEIHMRPQNCERLLRDLLGSEDASNIE